MSLKREPAADPRRNAALWTRREAARWLATVVAIVCLMVPTTALIAGAQDGDGGGGDTSQPTDGGDTGGDGGDIGGSGGDTGDIGGSGSDTGDTSGGSTGTSSGSSRPAVPTWAWVLAGFLLVAAVALVVRGGGSRRRPSNDAMYAQSYDATARPVPISAPPSEAGQTNAGSANQQPPVQSSAPSTQPPSEEQ